MRPALPPFTLVVALAVSWLQSAAWAGFTDIQQDSGIDYLFAGPGDPVQNHAGAAVVDVNGDGWSDIIVARFGERPFLYVNQGDGTFEEEGVARGLSGAVDASAFGAGDFDNDGDEDLYMAPHDKDRNWLYVNDGAGNFTEEALARGADLSTTIRKKSGYSIGLVDYDADGWLDIYISEGGILTSDENHLHSALLRNLGQDSPGHFENVTIEANLVQPIEGSGQSLQNGFATAWGDFDRDGWQDVYLVSDFGTSKMYWNNGDGTFLESTSASGMGKDEFGMGPAVGDYDADGLLDIYVTSIFDAFSLDRFDTHTGNKLYRYIGDRKFEETAFDAGVNLTDWGWGASFFDHDNDGDPDLVATNGSSISAGGNPDTTPFVPSATDPTTLFENDGTGSFENITAGSGIDDTDLGKALLILDYDNDGDEDIFIANSKTPPVFYENDAASSSNKWIRLKFVGDRSNRDGYGAIVVVDDDGRSQTSLYNPTNAYIGQREKVLHFGLGAAGETLDRVKVYWPSGVVQESFGLATNQIHVLIEPESSNALPEIVAQPVGGNFEKGSSVTLSVEAIGDPVPVFIWEKDGEPLDGETNSTLFIKRFIPYSTGTYRVKVINQNGFVYSEEVE
ncbi:MAG: FG-GAP-like repeat-containing protein, partial [Verrucomicrobiota bacterium]